MKHDATLLFRATLVVATVCAVMSAEAAARGPERHATLPLASMDGRHIAFSRDLGGDSAEVHVVGVDGSQPRLLASLSNGGAVWSWLRGGRQIVFEAHSGDSTLLRSVDIDGGAPRTVVALPALSVRLSNDGRHVVFTRGTWQRCRMFVSDLDGSHARALTDSTVGLFNMAWSPDDRTIAVTRLDSTRALQVWSFDVRTGAGRPLTAWKDGDGRPQWPAWSPDGKRIAFQVGRYDRQDPSQSVADIWVMDADGRNPRCITPHDRPWMDETPSWLPDGKRLAFQSTRTGRFEVWVMNTDGSGATQVTR